MEANNTSKIARPSPGIGEGDADRFSALPDQIISHILSFMETKYAVGTAVLSRRWQDLWTRVSNFDIDNRLVYKSLDEAQKLEPRSVVLKRRYLQCSRFVDKVMGQHKNLNSLCRFRFHFSVEYYGGGKVISDTRFERELVFGPPIEEIDVMIRGETEFGIPQCMRRIPENFYTLKNLKVAKLHGVVLDAINDPVFLPSARILQLQSVKMKDFESLRRIISGCPVLETLHIDSCHPSNRSEKDRIEVSLPCLKNLTISDYENWDDPMCPIIIEAPNLEDLYLETFAEIQFKGQSPLTCLHSAHVDVGEECQCSYQDLIRLLAQISNAKKMCLSGETLSHLSVIDYVHQLPIFPNLTHLIIRIGDFGPSSWVLHSLLNSASKLKSLVIDMNNHIGEPLRWKSLDNALTPGCLLSSLEEIEIKELVAYEDEMEMIAYLLKFGAVLKKVNMHVNCRFLEIMGRKDLMSLLKLPRRSSTCEVELLFPYEEVENTYSDSEDESDTDNITDDDDYDDDDDDDIDDEIDSDNEEHYL